LIDTYDSDALPTSPLTIAPIEEQDPLESRRAWAKVAAGITTGDMETTGIEKSKIENEQRALRQKEQTENRTWQRRYFSNVESDAILDTLGFITGLSVDADKTGGIWRFDEKKFEAWRKSTSTGGQAAETM
jgi:oxysterol-binding protein-related protein 9/10/11